MPRRFRHSLPAGLSIATLLLPASPSLAAWGPLNKDYGGNLQMELYTPSQPAPSPAILVALHYCSGHSSNTHGWFDSAADKNGFYIIAPDAGSGNTCFDSSLGRSGERADIVKMVAWVVDQKKADKSRVFAAGFSSGGCMTNTLLAIYPDVFAGGSAMPGVAAGGWPAGKSCPCNAPPTMWSTQQNATDGKFWGDKARSVFQFSGTRPCVQQWVGSSDEYGFAGWLPTVAAQFQNLGNLSAGTAGSGAPSGWARTVYKDSSGNVRMETNTKSGQAHNLIGVVPSDQVISFLGLDKPTGACGLVTNGGGGAGSGGAGGASTNGGAPGNGGRTSTNGGSSSSAGGSSSSAGGSSSSGGSPSSGGAFISNGGAIPLAGGSGNTRGGSSNDGSGGTLGSAGGSTSSTFGGNTARGGAANASGGATSAGAPNAAGGHATAGQAAGGNGDSDSGCSCSSAGAHRQNLALGGVIGLALGVGSVARRRRRRTVSSD